MSTFEAINDAIYLTVSADNKVAFHNWLSDAEDRLKKLRGGYLVKLKTNSDGCPVLKVIDVKMPKTGGDRG